MKTPLPEHEPLIAALRDDLPSEADRARVRARLVAAGLIAASTSALTTSAAGAAGAGASAGTGAATASIAPGAVAGASAAAGGAAAGTKAAVVAGTVKLAAVKTGLVSTIVALPVAAKVGVATTVVAIAASTVPLLTREAPEQRAAPVAVSTTARDAVETAPGRPSGLRTASPELAAPSPVPPADAVAREVLPPAPPSGVASPPLEPARDGSTAPASNEMMGAPHERAARRDAGRGVRASASRATLTRAPRSDTPAVAPVAGGGASTAVTPAASAAPAEPAAEHPNVALVNRTPRGSLAEETRVMERALVALAEGDAVTARRWLDLHAQRFPFGLLAPERARAAESLERVAREAR